jgi:hypothetical protein
MPAETHAAKKYVSPANQAEAMATPTIRGTKLRRAGGAIASTITLQSMELSTIVASNRESLTQISVSLWTLIVLRDCCKSQIGFFSSSAAPDLSCEPNYITGSQRFHRIYIPRLSAKQFERAFQLPHSLIVRWQAAASSIGADVEFDRETLRLMRETAATSPEGGHAVDARLRDLLIGNLARGKRFIVTPSSLSDLGTTF